MAAGNGHRVLREAQGRAFRTCVRALWDSVGSAGVILRSPDGVTWTAGWSGVPDALSDVTYRPR